MKRVLYTFLFMAGLSVMLSACSGGDYKANASSPANNSINPLKPLTASQFTWSGVDPVSANINGSPWVADSAMYFLDSTGANVIFAYNGTQALYLYFRNTWQGGLYNMGFNNYDVIGEWVNMDSSFVSTSWHISALGNSGEMYMQQNDTVVFKGRFYCQAVNSHGDIVNISNGYFNFNK